MTKSTRRNQHPDLLATAPATPADGFSWSESQTGTHSAHREPRERDEDAVEHTVTMLDYEGSPVATARDVPERQPRAASHEI